MSLGQWCTFLPGSQPVRLGGIGRLGAISGLRSVFQLACREYTEDLSVGSSLFRLRVCLVLGFLLPLLFSTSSVLFVLIGTRL